LSKPLIFSYSFEDYVIYIMYFQDVDTEFSGGEDEPIEVEISASKRPAPSSEEVDDLDSPRRKVIYGQNYLLYLFVYNCVLFATVMLEGTICRIIIVQRIMLCRIFYIYLCKLESTFIHIYTFTPVHILCVL